MKTSCSILVLVAAFFGSGFSASLNQTKISAKLLKEIRGMHLLGEPFNSISGSSHYFLISEDQVEWNQALKICESEGTKLVSIESAEKDADLIGFLASKGHTSVWSSGNDLLKNGDYNWKTTADPFSYTNWREGSAPLIPDCACVGINSVKEQSCNECIGTYKWDEEPCQLKKKFVCEI